MARPASLRASDSDREQIAERLRHATAEGRLLAEELEERLMVAFKARTYGELDALVSDLPPGSLARPQRPTAMHVVPRAVALVFAAVAVLAVLALAAVILFSVLALWIVWAAIGWWFLGRRRHHCVRYYRRYSGPPRGGSYRARYGTWRA